MDRTRDLRSLLERLPRKHQKNSRHKAQRQPPIQGFAELTKRIAADIALSELKLEKLHILCEECEKGQDTHSSSIDEMTYIVKQDISALNRALTRLKSLANNNTTRTSCNHYLAHMDTVTTALQRRLGSVSGPFRDLLGIRKKFIQRQNEMAEAAITQQHQNQNQNQNSFYGGPSTELRARGRQGQGIAEAVSLDMYDDNEAQKRREREKQTSAIESSLAQLEGVFTQLAGLVHEQGDLLLRIDDDLTSTGFHVEGAHTEITKYFASVSTNRGLMLKVFAVLLFIFVVFIYFRA